MKKKLGKNQIYQEGTLVAYGCTTCFCTCGTCTNCNRKSPVEMGTSVLDTVTDGSLDMKGLPYI
ncbi:MAG: hypothetical protein K2N34_15780 [Lachnospiraceae bacterium]|nr:hypothetical protein [Lachnospiraceae bacterium]